MIYLRCKYDIISVPSYAAGIYHRTQCDIISKIYHPFRQERISLKKRTFVGRQKFAFSWRARRDSNPQHHAPETCTLSVELRALTACYYTLKFAVCKGFFAEKIVRNPQEFDVCTSFVDAISCHFLKMWYNIHKTYVIYAAKLR